MDYTSIKVGQLPSATIAGTNLIPHEVDGLLKKATITDLAAFISANGAVGFRAVSVANGGTLPSTTQQEFILVGPGTYNNVGGGSPVTVTEELNALVSNGTFWFIGVQIPIESAAGGTANWGGITGTLSAQTDLQTALNNKQNSSADLSSIAGLTGTSGLLRKTAANTYSLDTNSYALDSSLSGYLPLTGGTLESSGSTNTLNINHSSGSGIALNISKNGNGEGLTIVKGSGSGNAASITGGVTLISELNLTTKLADAHINSAATWNAKIGGSGTTNYLPKFTGTSALGNSQIFDNGTNVGIGKTTTSSLLDVNGQIRSEYTNTGGNVSIISRNLSSTSGGTSQFIAINDAGRGLRVQYSASGGFGPSALTGGISGEGAQIFTDGNYPLLLGTNVSANMYLGTNGNVGIGTTSPSAKLDVNSVIRATNTSSASFQVSALELYTYNGTSVSAGASLFSTNSNFNYGTIVSNQTNLYGVRDGGIRIATGVAPIVFSNGNADVDFATERMRITSSGNVRIGTGTPTQKLDVDGLINSTNGISVGGSGVSVVWTGTQAAYDAITTKSSTTIYFIQ
jgi:hypothetical protein